MVQFDVFDPKYELGWFHFKNKINIAYSTSLSIPKEYMISH
jgi:hypothetical protein